MGRKPVATRGGYRKRLCRKVRETVPDAGGEVVVVRREPMVERFAGRVVGGEVHLQALARESSDETAEA